MRLQFILAACATLAFASAANAQPAPITFAGRDSGAQTQAPVRTEISLQTASTDAGLAGGDERSYGYGGTQPRRRGAVIDLRRPGQPRTEPISFTPAAQTEEEVEETPTLVAEQQQAPAPQQQVQPTTEQGRPAWLEQERVGPPYQAGGQWYVPTPEPGYEQTGMASWYGPTFNGGATASGEQFDEMALTAAHPTLPIPSLVQVTNLENGREVIVRVNDRGPFVGGRLIDLSRGAAQVLGIEQQGQARVHIRYLGPAPRHVNAQGVSVATPSPQPAVTTLAGGPAAEEGPIQLTPPRTQAAVTEQSLPQMQSSAPPAAGGYFVQVGAFSDLNNAHRVRSAILTAGPVVVDTRETARGELFRVRVGPFQSRAEADDARAAVADLGYGEAVIASR
ncbi:septal ring lytic transglycosylase RlpA family protein [Terricaulis sp.]|uniref:septal ring lytic transglycosylase RlpA family protein n=1 Tax=Terricaulis sp. TaxID=2768686 RepID=UPI003784CB16